MSKILLDFRRIIGKALLTMKRATTQFLDELQSLGALADGDISEIIGVSTVFLDAWRTGTAKPSPIRHAMLCDLRDIVVELAEMYEPAEVRQWLYAEQPLLSGARPVDVVRAKRAYEVQRIISEAAAGRAS